MRRKKKILKKIFNFYNLGILVCVLFIIGSLTVLIGPDVKLQNIKLPNIKFPEINFDKNKDENDDKITIVDSKTKDGDSITEQDAIKLAISQFKKLGEKDLNTKDVTCLEIEREGEHYYYICSPQNTLEIKIVGGKITRLNSVPVDNL